MDNRSLILNCALDLFAARGYDAVGVQEIAEAASITKPTLYHYFGSKAGLMEALLVQYHDPLTANLQQASEYHGDLPLTLEKIARAYFDYALQHPVYYRMQIALVFSPRQSEAHRMISARNEEQHGLVEEMFRLAVNNHGNMRGRQRIYAATFIGTINTCIGMWLNGYTELDDLLLRRVVHQFQHGIYS
jgi:AcrR family transcriptional regulator